MALLAVVLAQITDPFRVIILGVVFVLARIGADHPLVRWFWTAFAAACVAGFFPHLLGKTGDAYNQAALVGFLSSAILIAVFMLIARLFRGRV